MHFKFTKKKHYDSLKNGLTIMERKEKEKMKRNAERKEISELLQTQPVDLTEV